MGWKQNVSLWPGLIRSAPQATSLRGGPSDAEPALGPMGAWRVRMGPAVPRATPGTLTFLLMTPPRPQLARCKYKVWALWGNWIVCGYELG